MKTEAAFSWDNFYKTPVVGIIRGLPLDIVHRIAQSFLETEFSTLEVTMNTNGAKEMIKELRMEYPELNVGAGTVCSLSDLHQAIDAGVQYIVTPIVNKEVIQSSVAQGIPIFPGAFTPSEIYSAWSLGASAVKVFPATTLGPQYIRDVLAPLNNIKLLPTGGVTIENINSFFRAGAIGVGMGSSLFSSSLIRQDNLNGLKSHFRSIREKIEEFVQSKHDRQIS